MRLEQNRDVKQYKKNFSDFSKLIYQEKSSGKKKTIHNVSEKRRFTR